MQTAVSVQNDAYLIVFATTNVCFMSKYYLISESNKIKAIELTRICFLCQETFKYEINQKYANSC